MKILLAADGSEYTRRATRQLVKLAAALAQPPEIHLLNVHPPLPYAGAAAIAESPVTKYHADECAAALAVAEAVLLDASVPFYRSTWIAGNTGEMICGYAATNAIDLIVMGSHGHGTLRNLTLGSVADAVLRQAPCPVMIAR
ncbi:universal stress protein [Usitatibacter palustris]|uniref:UspA domain-containing protein n=1 Tax=Usitatibacter palustris TaxID=2732487 RepID=A0A6M4H4Z4_9PROT|nr:universal stress protein [Usitatibacter palustris]QJR14235.1 hypothetical protein DSM104440_01028 [Usitatibacter palustris]